MPSSAFNSLFEAGPVPGPITQSPRYANADTLARYEARLHDRASVTSLGFMIKLGQERPTAHDIFAILSRPIAPAIVTTGDCALIGHAHQYRRPPGAL